MTFVDYCSDCGEPATSWLANRPREAWCRDHTPGNATVGDWSTCTYCAFAYDDTQPGLYIDHLEGHVRAYRDELAVAGMRTRDLQQHLRVTSETLVSVGRELLAVVS